MSSYVYLIYDIVYKSSGRSVYKIGKTENNVKDRMKGYPKGTEPIIFAFTRNCTNLENKLIEIFSKNFKLFRGKEWFEGDLIQMKILFSKCILEDYEEERLEYIPQNKDQEKIGTPAVEIIPEVKIPVLKTPFEIELETKEFNKDFVSKNIKLLSYDLIKKGEEGFAEFIRLIVNFQEGEVRQNFKYNKEKEVFEKLTSTSKWIPDRKNDSIKHIFEVLVANQYIIILYDTKASLMDTIRRTDEEVRKKLENEYDIIGKIISVLKNPKDRNLFIKKIMNILKETL